LINPSEFRRIVSGQRRDWRAIGSRCLLEICAVPYRWAVQWRNRGYDSRRRSVTAVEVPVISVGNLTLGGTGKTPMVEWLCQWFRAQHVRVCILSRGYHAVDGGANDEALELEEKLPEVPHLQNPDRVAAARVAIDELATQVIVLDDGFQHRRLQRTLDIVLLDALEPFGFEHVFPRGTLREPLTGLRRADVIGLTRADMLDEGQRRAIRARVASYNPQAIWLELVHQPCALRQATGENHALPSAGDRLRVAAFCGIGNPDGFRHSLHASGFEIAAFREFPDHHHFSREDVQSLIHWANELPNVETVLCTYKDLVKIGIDLLGQKKLFALTVEMRIDYGKDRLESRLREIARTAIAADGED
jgi:tetraacyldisaccharide 4'-kinase